MARWILDCQALCGHPWKLGVATESREREKAYRLRFDVFFREMKYGAPSLHRDDGRDIDAFDEWCDHLILVDWERYELIGCCRVIRGAEAIRRGGLYGCTEFELSALDPIAPWILQGSRTCIHPAHRTGSAFQYISYGMELLLREYGCRYFLGVESFRPESSDELNVIYSYVRRFGTDPRWAVEPTPACQVANLLDVPVTAADERRLPPIIRRDLRMGFRACGPPAWDAEFRSHDFLILGQRDRVTAYYRTMVERIERALPADRNH